MADAGGCAEQEGGESAAAAEEEREDAATEGDDSSESEEPEPQQPAEAAPASLPGGGTQRKSRFALVYRNSQAKPGHRAFFGLLSATSQHPALRTPSYHTEEEAAHAVDRCGAVRRRQCARCGLVCPPYAPSPVAAVALR